MTTNPMDGYRDIHPWPWHWSRDIAGYPVSRLATVSALYEDLDFWTYVNHWSRFDGDLKTPPRYCTDIYWRDDAKHRLQLPPPIGHQVADVLLAQNADRIKVLLWHFREWRPVAGWNNYTGPQGDFVDHIHVEWKADPDEEGYTSPTQPTVQ